MPWTLRLAALSFLGGISLAVSAADDSKLRFMRLSAMVASQFMEYCIAASPEQKGELEAAYGHYQEVLVAAESRIAAAGFKSVFLDRQTVEGDVATAREMLSGIRSMNAKNACEARRRMMISATPEREAQQRMDTLKQADQLLQSISDGKFK